MEGSMKTYESEMENGKLTKLVLKYAVPCVVAMIVSALYNIVDQIFIGQGVGYIGNAATNVVFPLIVLAQGFAFLMGDGAAAFYSIKLGENNKEEGAKGIGNAVTMLFIIGIVFLIAGYAFLEKLLWCFGATSTNMPYALGYAKIVRLSIPFTILMCGLSSIIRADGSPQYGMISLMAGTILNFILDPVFIFIFHMGVEGAAIATVIGEAISCLICLNYLRKFRNIKFNKSLLKIDLKVTKTIMLYGLSTFITQMAVMIIVIVSNNMLALYGAQSIYGSDIPLSSMGIVMKVNDVLIGIVLGIAAGGQPIVGYNYGAGNVNRVKDAYFIIIKLASILSVIAFLMFQFLPQDIIYLFGKNNDLYNDFAVKSFQIYLMLCMFTGFELATVLFFQSIGHPIKAIILTICKQTIFIIPLMLILPRFFGVTGVLYAGPLAEALSVVVTMILVRIQFKEFNMNSSMEAGQLKICKVKQN